MNIIRNSCRKITAAVLLVTAVCFTATASDLVQLLPRQTATVIEVDFAALCNHRQGAVLFDRYFAALTDAPLERIAEACYGCDAAGRCRAALIRFDLPETLTALTARLADKREQDKENPAYILRTSPESRRFYRLYPLTADTLGIYWKFPENPPFEVDRRGVAVQLRRQVPVRSGVMLWAVGNPRSENQYLKQISAFDFVLESGVDGRLLIHGKVVCRSAMGAGMVVLFLNTIAPGLLQNKYQIPADVTSAAVNALKIRRDGKYLFFSSSDVEPVIALLSFVVKDMIPDYRAVMN